MMATMEKQPPSEYGNHHPGSVHSGYSNPPPSHQTVVTMTTDPNPNISRTEINLNIGYFTTLPGWVKVAQLVSHFILFFSNSLTRQTFKILYIL